jgi:hypothetical protein
VTEAWRRVCAQCDALCTLLVELCALDDVLDDFLLVASLLIVAPPHWSLVLALQTKMFAGATRRLSLITLLASQATCEAPCTVSVS